MIFAKVFANVKNNSEGFVTAAEDLLIVFIAS